MQMIRGAAERAFRPKVAGYLPAPGSPGAIQVVKKSLSPALSAILSEAQRELGYAGAEAGESKTAILSSGQLGELVQKVSQRLGFELGSFERDEVLAQIEKEQKPFGILQPLVDEDGISDIIVSDHAHISVQQGRRNFDTDLSFASQGAYEVFVERLLQKAGTTYSTKKPVADGMVGSLVRVHAVHKCVCEGGPYLTLRINRFSRVSVGDLCRKGLGPREVLDYLAALVACGQTILVCGEVGTGKTTLARALAATIPQDESILVIEDTREISLEHPHVRYLSTREANSDGAGRVAPAECIRAGMRMAMNRIIFGEMRDAEAAEAFIDVCASGHPGLSTVHARSASEAVARLELFLGRAQRGAARSILTEQISNAVQAVVYVDVCKASGKRRIIEVKEVGPVADGVLRQREIFRYQYLDGMPLWRLSGRVSAHRELIESIDRPVVLSNLPATLELSPEILLEESGDPSR